MLSPVSRPAVDLLTPCIPHPAAMTPATSFLVPPDPPHPQAYVQTTSSIFRSERKKQNIDKSVTNYEQDRGEAAGIWPSLYSRLRGAGGES